jgi:hypothetical protein
MTWTQSSMRSKLTSLSCSRSARKSRRRKQTFNVLQFSYSELSQLSGRTSNVTVVAPNDIETLRVQELELENLNNQIRNLTEQLEHLVADSMKNNQNNEFALSALNFEIESLRLKLDYLKKLKDNSDSG